MFPLRLVVPSELVPSLKVTVPVGVALAGATGLTVAVKTTAWPNVDGFGDEPAAVLLLPLLTCWVKVADVLVLKLASPS